MCYLIRIIHVTLIDVIRYWWTLDTEFLQINEEITYKKRSQSLSDHCQKLK